MKKITSTSTGVFLRGTFNNWNLDNEFALCSDGSYVAKNVRFAAGTNEFKIADSNWSGSCNYGYENELPGMFCFKYTLTANSNSNMTITTKRETLVDVYLYKTGESVQIRLKPVKTNSQD